MTAPTPDLPPSPKPLPTKAYTLSELFIFLLAGLAAVYELVAYRDQQAGDGATISQAVWHWQVVFPLTFLLFTIAFGIFQGHLFLCRNPALGIVPPYLWLKVGLSSVGFAGGMLIGTYYVFQRP
jgi:hypothetical protein